MLTLVEMRDLVAQFDEQLNEAARSFGDFELDRSAKRTVTLEVTLKEDAQARGKLDIEGVVKLKPVGRISFSKEAWLETDSKGNTWGTWYDPAQDRLPFDGENVTSIIKEGAEK